MTLALSLLLSALAGPQEEFRERILATVPEEAALAGLAVFSEDGTRVATVERDGDARRAVCGAWKSRPFDVVC